MFKKNSIGQILALNKKLNCSFLSLSESASILSEQKLNNSPISGMKSLSLPDMCHVIGDPASLANEPQFHFTPQKAEVWRQTEGEMYYELLKAICGKLQPAVPRSDTQMVV